MLGLQSIDQTPEGFGRGQLRILLGELEEHLHLRDRFRDLHFHPFISITTPRVDGHPESRDLPRESS